MNPATVDQIINNSGIKLDASLSITAVLAVCAIISPIFVALINNHHQLKLRKLEMKHDEAMYRQRELCNRIMILFETYLGALEKYVNCPTDENKESYSSAFGHALLYASDTTQNGMLNIDKSIKSSTPDTISKSISRNVLDDISFSLKNDLNNIKSNKQN